MKRPRSRYLGEHVYIVAWPEHRIVKAGYTSQTRWRRFMGRGAILIRLTRFDSCTAALDYETEVEEYLREHGAPAFTDRDDARPLIGNLGGHVECVRLHDWTAVQRLPPPPLAHTITIPFREYQNLTSKVGV